MMKTRETPKSGSEKMGSRQRPAGTPAREPDQPAPGAGNGESDARPGITAGEPKAEAGKPADGVDRLATMKVGELQALLAEITGEKTRSPNRTYLVRRIMEAAVPVAPAGALPEVEAQAIGAADPAPAVQAGPNAAQLPPAGLDFEDAAVVVPAQTLDATTGHPAADPIAMATMVPPTTSAASPAATTGQKLSKLDIPALQALYAEVTGRQTRSTHRGSLIYRIREAQKGNRPVSPRASRQQDSGEIKVLPLRMEANMVEKLDQAWRRQGLASRMELFRIALGAYLTSVGEIEVAGLLSSEA